MTPQRNDVMESRDLWELAYVLLIGSVCGWASKIEGAPPSKKDKPSNQSHFNPDNNLSLAN